MSAKRKWVTYLPRVAHKMIFIHEAMQADGCSLYCVSVDMHIVLLRTDRDRHNSIEVGGERP